MSDQDQVVEVVDAAPEMPEVEITARASGWVPKDDFHGDPNRWVDAGEFVRRAPLFEKIDFQNRELKELKKGLDELKQHHSKVRETEYQRALTELKAAKKDALLDGDVDEVFAIDDKLEAVKDAKRRFEHEQAVNAAKASEPEQLHPEFAAWTKRNNWYETSKPMRAFADALGLELADKGVSPSEVLKQVEAQVKEEFPNKFRNPNRDKAPNVEGTSKGGGKSGGSGTASLSDEERRIMRTFVRTGVMSEEQYVAELKKVKGN